MLSALLLTLALPLTACGAAAPYPSPAETAAGDPAPVSQGLAVMIFRDGGVAAVDLDGDGVLESVGYSSAGSLTVNGRELWQELLELGYPAEYPADNYFAIADIDGSDGLLEIAIMDFGPSDDYTTHFFRYEGGALAYLGYLNGVIYSDRGGVNPVAFNGDGTGTQQIRFGVLQTWFGSTGWSYSDGEGFTEVRPEIYDAYSDRLTALADLACYAENDETSERSVLPAGTELVANGTDNDQWVRVYVYTADANGYFAWLHLDAEYGQQVETADGYELSGQVLDGLIFAD